CSLNSGCVCFHIAGAVNIGICTDQLFADCVELVPCDRANNICNDPEHRCVHHPRCHNNPVCYPIPSFNRQLCPLAPTTSITITITTTTTTSAAAAATTTTARMTTTTTTKASTQQLAIPNIPVNAQWSQNGTIVAGGNAEGNATNQLFYPHGLFVYDDDQTIVISEFWNHRVMQWKIGDTHGKIIAGGKGEGNRLDQLYLPSDVLFDKQTDSFIVCDYNNSRIVLWPRHNGTRRGTFLINNITCWGLVMDHQRHLYVSDYKKHEVRRYQLEGNMKNGTLVAGENEQVNDFDAGDWFYYIFVDRYQAVYISNTFNHSVTKWNNGAKEGIIVAGGQG
ncbi:unnamed protein product, partial [Rotaria magnacalcarata]